MSRFRNATANAAFAVLLSLFAATAVAGGAGPLEGTWGGADARGRAAQIIVAGDSVIGVYWIDDYRDAPNRVFLKAAHGSILRLPAARRPRCAPGPARASPCASRTAAQSRSV